MKNRRNLILDNLPNISLIRTLLELQDLLKDCNSMLDLGCGSNSPLRFIDLKKIGVDGHRPSLEQAKKNKTHDGYKLLDIRELSDYFSQKSFDAVVALDVIEHLPKKEGHKMLKDMERIARKKIIILTPNGFIPQISENGDLQEHLSGWSVGDFKKNGFKVFGLMGHKSLRGEKHIIKYRPKIIWVIISELLNIFYTRNTPEKASALLSIKQVKST